MAKKQKNKIIQEKIKYKKPVKSCNTAIDEIARIKRNERAKMLRREKKEFELIMARGKGYKAKVLAVRKEINSFGRKVKQADKSLGTVKGYCEAYAETAKEQKSLKAKIKRLEKQAEKLYEGKDYVGQKKVNNELYKFGSKLRKINQAKQTILLKTNKELGFEYKDLGEFFTKKQFEEMKAHDELSADEIDELERDYPDLTFDYKKDIEQETEHYTEELEAELESMDEDWVVHLVDTIWVIWKDFDSVEVPRLTDYEKVIFTVEVPEEEGQKTFKGGQQTLINVYAQRIWGKLREFGSKIRATKLISTDNTKLKYLFELV